MTRKRPDFIVTLLATFFLGLIITGFASAQRDTLQINPNMARASAVQVQLPNQ